MNVEQVIVLVLSAGSLLGMLVWLLYSNLRRRWPSGERFDVVYEKPGTSMPYLVHVIFSPGVRSSGLAKNDAAKAVWASGAAWNIAMHAGRVTKDDSELYEVIVLFASDDVMAAKAASWGYKSVSGYIDRHQTKKWFGDVIPMIVIGDSHKSELAESGEPCIHECMHALERDYVAGADDHSNPVVWASARGREMTRKPSIQEMARAIFEAQAVTDRSE